MSLLREKDLKEFPLEEVSLSPLSVKINIAMKAQLACPPDVVGMSIATMSLAFQQSYPKAGRAFRATLRACQ